MSKIAFIGFGEAASAIVSGWGSHTHDINAYDIKLSNSETEADILQRCERYGVTAKHSAAEAVEHAELVFSTVTADQALVAARSSLDSLCNSTYYLDLNSCAPSTKTAAAELVEQTGAHYIDVAVMAPVHPALNLVPLLISGAKAETVLPQLAALPMKPVLVAGNVGAASSVKMLRSVMVKGLEALTAECTLAAVAAGVEEQVFASLNKSHPGSDWDRQAAYNFERSVVHGERRASEMREVAKTLDALGIPNDMVRATVEWQSRLGQVNLPASALSVDDGAKPVAQAILKVLPQTTKQ